ncbi:hypothetical protein SPONN_368 [uncultured Candidatus Thioglobus sp.]|nr:hypothetical protein SPONN_368 [uncultured Candidatus Thioglobus sp.]
MLNSAQVRYVLLSTGYKALLSLFIYIFCCLQRNQPMPLFPCLLFGFVSLLYDNYVVFVATSKLSKSTIAVVTAVPILSLVSVAVVAGLIILAVVVMLRKKERIKPFDFQPMSHSELELKDLESYLGTDEGSFPGTRTGVIAAPSKNGTGGGEGGGVGIGTLRDVDLDNQDYETTSVKGHLV